MSDGTIDPTAQGGMVNLFLLNEFRDLRKGMEARDESLRASIDGVRESVNVLSAKVDRSQSDVDAMRRDVEMLQKESGMVRGEVDEILDRLKTDAVRQESAWSGPAKWARNIALIGAAATGLIAIVKFWPAVVAIIAV